MNLPTSQHLPVVLPVCPLPATACTYHVLCATGSTLPLALPTQSEDRDAEGKRLCCPYLKVCRSSRRTSGDASLSKPTVNNSNRQTANLFYNHNKSLHVSTHQCRHQYSSTERIDRIYLCWQKWYLVCLLFVGAFFGFWFRLTVLLHRITDLFRCFNLSISVKC